MHIQRGRATLIENVNESVNVNHMGWENFVVGPFGAPVGQRLKYVVEDNRQRFTTITRRLSQTSDVDAFIAESNRKILLWWSTTTSV
jgi:hypothetical protein